MRHDKHAINKEDNMPDDNLNDEEIEEAGLRDPAREKEEVVDELISRDG
jgi:hypothetical protein